MPKYGLNQINKGDGFKLLADLIDDSVGCVFYDPQYRSPHGSSKTGAAGRRHREYKEQPDELIEKFIKEIERVLKPSSYLFLWTDQYHMLHGTIHQWLAGSNLEIKGMITWNRGKLGMGTRVRHCSEHIIVIQKGPFTDKNWKDKAIRDVVEEKVDTKNHMHAKPVELQARLITCVTNPGDLVVDPCSGGFSVLESSKLAGRNFLGTDLRPTTK